MLDRIVRELKKYKKDLLWIIAFLILFYFLLPDKETIITTLNEIKGADLTWIIFGNIIYYLTIPLYALQIFVLSKIKLNFWITYKVQMSVLFINKFLPTSISSFVMNSFYLEKVGSRAPQIASILSLQALTSSIPFILLFALAIIIGIFKYDLGSSLNVVFSDINLKKLIILLLIFILIFIFIYHSSETVKKYIKNSISSFWLQFKDYRNRPKSIFWALMTGFISPFFGVTVLYASGQSVGLELTFIQSFLIYALATTLSTLIPTPGGIGAAEAGLYAGFMMLGFPPGESMAATIIYRLITFWIPIFPGFYFFVNLKKSILKGFTLKKKKYKKS